MEKTNGPTDLSVAKMLTNVALAASKQHNYSHAESLYQRALDIYDKTLDVKPVDKAKACAALAVTQVKLGKQKEAVPLFERAIVISDQAGEYCQPNVIALGKVFEKLGQDDKAEVLYQRVVIPRRKNKDPYEWLVELYLSGDTDAVIKFHVRKGNLKLAESMLKEQVQDWGKDGPSLFSSKEMAVVYIKENKYPEAKPFVDKALLATTEYTDDDGFNDLRDLAHELRASGRKADAIIIEGKIKRMHSKAASAYSAKGKH